MRNLSGTQTHSPDSNAHKHGTLNTKHTDTSRDGVNSVQPLTSCAAQNSRVPPVRASLTPCPHACLLTGLPVTAAPPLHCSAEPSPPQPLLALSRTTWPLPEHAYFYTNCTAEKKVLPRRLA